MLLIAVAIGASVVVNADSPAVKSQYRIHADELGLYVPLATSPYLLTAVGFLLTRTRTLGFWLVNYTAGIVAACGVGILLKAAFGTNELESTVGLATCSLVPLPFACVALIIGLYNVQPSSSK